MPTDDGYADEYNRSIMKYFPGSLPGHDVDICVYKKLESLGFNAQNTLFADSQCADEINRDNPKEDVALLL